MNLAERQWFAETCPRSSSLGIPAQPQGSGGVVFPAQNNVGPGLVATIATSAVASVLNLNLLFKPTKNPSLAAAAMPGIVGGATPSDENNGNFVTIFADTTDLGILFGPTKASVTGANVPALAAVGTVDANGVYSLNATTGQCWRIATGTSKRFLLQPGQDLFLGFVATGAGIIRLYQSSPQNP